MLRMPTVSERYDESMKSNLWPETAREKAGAHNKRGKELRAENRRRLVGTAHQKSTNLGGARRTGNCAVLLLPPLLPTHQF